MWCSSGWSLTWLPAVHVAELGLFEVWEEAIVVTHQDQRPSVVFVHGTGVRAAAYKETFEVVADQLAKHVPRAVARPCLWGDNHGAKLHLGGRSIPGMPQPDAAGQARAGEQALWSELYRDSLYELRGLADGQAPGFVAPQVLRRKADLHACLRGLGKDAMLLQQAAGRSLAGIWCDSVCHVSESAEFNRALTFSAQVDGDLRRTIARAVVAQVQSQLIDSGLPTMGQVMRDDWVRQCVEQLGGGTLGLGHWVEQRVAGLASWWLTSKARRDRASVFDPAYPLAGDILCYQANGQAIRDAVAAAVDSCTGDVVLLAHSLGGIACVDLLVESPMPKVKLLVTVGSQAPFLYELGALRSLGVFSPLPEHVPPWVNYFDRDDLLSYCAAPVFPGRVTDIELESGENFPASHSAYWRDDNLWSTLATRI
jgi:hypothetical protein